MRLAFWRTEKPVARPVLQPGADSPYVPRLGVWMAANAGLCRACGRAAAPMYVVYGMKDPKATTGKWNMACDPMWAFYCEGCGATLVAQLRREREG